MSPKQKTIPTTPTEIAMAGEAVAETVTKQAGAYIETTQT